MGLAGLLPRGLARVILSVLATPGGSGRGQWGSLARACRSPSWNSEAATKVVPSFSHAGPSQLCGDAGELVCWDLPLAGPERLLALTWPPRSRSHALG